MKILRHITESGLQLNSEKSRNRDKQTDSSKKKSETLLLFFFKWPCFFLGFVVFIIDKENVTVRNETLPKPSHLETAIWHSNQNGVISWLEFSAFHQCEPAFERLKQIPFFLSANG